MVVSRAVALRGPAEAGSSPACRPLWPGLRTRCQPAGSRPWLARKRCAPETTGIRHAATVSHSPGEEEPLMAPVMIGIDPHKGSHTAVAIGADEEPLRQVRVPAPAAQGQKLVAWAADWPQRTRAGGGAPGPGYPPAQPPGAGPGRGLGIPPQPGGRAPLAGDRGAR